MVETLGVILLAWFGWITFSMTRDIISPGSPNEILSPTARPITDAPKLLITETLCCLALLC